MAGSSDDDDCREPSGGMDLDLSEEEEDDEDEDEEEEEEEDEEEEEEEEEEEAEFLDGEFESESEGPCTEEEYREELHWALTNVDRPGSFCAEGTLKTYGPPGLEVAGLGPIGLPLAPFQAKELAKLCSQAPFGRREATMYDPSVRRCLQLSPDQFRLQGPDWAAQVQRLVNLDIKRGLGVPESCKVVPKLHKLLLYEAGSFFRPHRDSEKEDGMFGTLAIVLPSAHKGGELVVRHAGREELLNFGSRCLYQVHYAAFYADCEHEILPVKSGHRLVLVYNLIIQGETGELKPADNRQAVKDVLAAIRAWSEDEEGPTKLVIPLEHQYSSRSLSFHGLKGADIATVDILCQAAKVSDNTLFHFFLGMLKRSESGAEDDIDDDMEATLQLSDIIAPPGETVRYHKLECDEDEIVPEDALEDRGWDHERSIDTGNEGMTVERWYRHAAIIIWPQSKHWDVACISNVGKAIKEVSELVQTAQNMQLALEETLAEGGHLSRGEAALVVELVMEHGDVHILAEIQRSLRTMCVHGKRLTAPLIQTLTRLLLKHGDVEMAQTFLNHFPSPADGPVVPALASRFGWAALEDDIVALLVRVCDNYSLADCFKLLLRLAPKITETAGQAGQAESEMGKEASGLNQAASRAGQTESEMDHGMAEASGTASEATGTGRTASKQGSGGSEQLAGMGSIDGDVGGVGVSEGLISDSDGGAFSKESCWGEKGATGSGRLAPPRKSSKDEREREELCERAVLELVGLLSQDPRPGVESAYSYGGKQNFSFTTQSLPPFVRLIERFGEEWFRPAADALIRNKLSGSLTSAAELLWDFVRTGGKLPSNGEKEVGTAYPELSSCARGFCQHFARELVNFLTKEEDSKPHPYPYLPHGRGSHFIARVLRTLHRLQIEQATIDSAAAHFLATPVLHPIDTAVVPALKELSTWLEEEAMNTSWFAKFWTGCMAVLQSECEQVPAEPKNWALPAGCDCACQNCRRLLEFCQDPKRTEMRFPPSAGAHIRASVFTNRMPVNVEDDFARGVLTCIKKGSRGISDEIVLKELLEKKEKHAKYLKAMGDLETVRGESCERHVEGETNANQES